MATSPTTLTSITTAMEHDFTVEGKKGNLGCPFQTARPKLDKPTQQRQTGQAHDPTPHHSADPICAAMYEEVMAVPPPVNGSPPTPTCPIRYLGQHSPEEIAQYVEKHKHEIPRSHEVCLHRYQKNEDQIRKLDAKYGNLVDMIKDLGHLHQPMLPLAAARRAANRQNAVSRTSNERVEEWAQRVSNSQLDDTEKTEKTEHTDAVDLVNERQNQFDRPLKEVRVGESPSRPWGISMPADASSLGEVEEDGHPESPPPAPVMMLESSSPVVDETTRQKCPISHANLTKGHQQLANHHHKHHKIDNKSSLGITHPGGDNGGPPHQAQQFFPIFGNAASSPPPPPQPAFINPPTVATAKEQGNVPQMLFTGPVFIGYPMEQAIQFMQNVHQQSH